MKWEYADVAARTGTVELSKELDKMGSKGWELACVVREDTAYSIAYFKRPVAEERETDVGERLNRESKLRPICRAALNSFSGYSRTPTVNELAWKLALLGVRPPEEND